MSTVVIGCKLPNGLILQVGDKQHAVNGFNHSYVVGGHGITDDVPQDFWDAWVAENKDRAVLKNGFIFAHAKQKDVKAEATEKKATRSKTEPLDPSSKAGGVEKLDE